MQIQIGHGIGALVFGMARDNVRNAIGEPSEIMKPNEDLHPDSTDWKYNEIQLTARFYDNHEGRLAWLESSYSDLLLFNKRIIGMGEQEIVELMKNNGYPEYEIDEYPSFNVVDFGDSWISFDTSYRMVREVELGTQMDDDENYIWPFVP